MKHGISPTTPTGAKARRGRMVWISSHDFEERMSPQPEGPAEEIQAIQSGAYERDGVYYRWRRIRRTYNKGRNKAKRHLRNAQRELRRQRLRSAA